MRFVSIIFDYDLDKMVRCGRIWAKQGYEGKQHILEYSAASIATVLHHNPHIPYIVWTDDGSGLSNAVDGYDVDRSSLSIIDASSTISRWKQHEYCFWPATKFSELMLSSDEPTVKLDNDLTCLKPCDDLFQHEGALVWKFERKCSLGRDYWGEKHAAQRAFGTTEFNIYNIGVFSLLGPSKRRAHELSEMCQRMVNVDVADVVRFPEDPTARTKVWSCSEQTANCYFIHKHGLNVRETHDHFLHHCYEKTKSSCVLAAQFLRK